MTLRDDAEAALIARFGINANRAPDEGFSVEVIGEILAALAPLFDRVEQMEKDLAAVCKTAEQLDVACGAFERDSEEWAGRARAAEALAEDWRGWVRFVLADAPSPPSDVSKEELRQLVCQHWDRWRERTDAAESRAEAAEARLAQIEKERDKNEHACYHCGATTTLRTAWCQKCLDEAAELRRRFPPRPTQRLPSPRRKAAPRALGKGSA